MDDALTILAIFLGCSIWIIAFNLVDILLVIKGKRCEEVVDEEEGANK